MLHRIDRSKDVSDNPLPLVPALCPEELLLSDSDDGVAIAATIQAHLRQKKDAGKAETNQWGSLEKPRFIYHSEGNWSHLGNVIRTLRYLAWVPK